jgi:hypothetical protein
MSAESAIAAAVRPAAAHDEAPRAALALGLVGSLGEELLAALVASPRYRLVHVQVRQPMASAARKFRPWVAGTSIIAVDDAFLCLGDAALPHPEHSPLVPYAASQIVAAAELARDAGARRLVVVAPLGALLQMNAATQIVSSEQELALVDMHFETLLIVRPTRDDAATGTGSWLQRTVGAMGRAVLGIMLPAQVQALQPKTAAAAILTALDRTPSGVNVLGARQLAALVAEALPAAPVRLSQRIKPR